MFVLLPSCILVVCPLVTPHLREPHTHGGAAESQQSYPRQAIRAPRVATQDRTQVPQTQGVTAGEGVPVHCVAVHVLPSAKTYSISL